MALAHRLAGLPSIARCVAGACAVAAAAAQAMPYELVYTGTFDTTESLNLATAGTPVNFAASTPFTIRARFDDSTPNLAPPLPFPPFTGFRAYAPSSVTITIGATNYSVDSASVNLVNGVTVAIFDQASFDPGHYAVGLFVDPVNDGAGVVGDFLSASPNFTAAALTPTVFTDYFGVGHSSGVCVPGTGIAPDCTHVVTPWTLRDGGGTAWNLTFANFEVDYPVAHKVGASVTPFLDMAQINAVPEPATTGLMLAGLAGLGAVACRRRAVSRRLPG